MTVKITKPALNLREEIAKAQSNNADEARIGSLVSDSIDAVAIDAEQLSVGGWVSGNPNYNDIVINSPNNGGLTIFTNSPTAYGGVVFHDDNTQTSTNRNSYAGGIYYQHTGNAMEFHTNTQERARINAAGQVLIGKTADDTSVAGVRLSSAGSTFTSDNSPVGYFNRNTSDGDVVTFRRSNTTVGSIASRAGAVLSIVLDPRSSIGAGLTGGNRSVTPTNETGANIDAAVDLGQSVNRFKNLYLSGGVYLGGTGATNLLDDYEEGTWTPVIVGGTTAGTGTYTYAYGYYTKIGRQVTLHIRTAWSAHTGTGSMRVQGLPFACSPADGYSFSVGSIALQDCALPASTIHINVQVGSGTTTVDLIATRDNTTLTNVQMDSAVTAFTATLTYFTA